MPTAAVLAGLRLVTSNGTQAPPTKFGAWLPFQGGDHLPKTPHKLNVMGVSVEFFRADGYTSIVLHGRTAHEGEKFTQLGTQIMHVRHNVRLHDTTVYKPRRAGDREIRVRIQCGGCHSPVEIVVFYVENGWELGIRMWWHNKRLHSDPHNQSIAALATCHMPTHRWD